MLDSAQEEDEEECSLARSLARPCQASEPRIRELVDDDEHFSRA